jgi:hypothetical protein
MRPIAAAAALAAAAFAAAPASATQGQDCRPASGAGPRFGIVLGSGAGSVVAGVSLVERGVAGSTFGARAPLAIGQSWVDAQRLWIDLTDGDAMRYEARIRLAWTGRGRARHLAGTIARGGRLYAVRCEES